MTKFLKLFFTCVHVISSVVNSDSWLSLTLVNYYKLLYNQGGFVYKCKHLTCIFDVISCLVITFFVFTDMIKAMD